MKRTDLTILQRFWLETLWLGARVFAVMPYWFKYYVVENLLFVLLYYCLRYRMKVVKTNLRNSFPEKSERELPSSGGGSTARCPKSSSTRSTWPT